MTSSHDNFNEINSTRQLIYHLLMIIDWIHVTEVTGNIVTVTQWSSTSYWLSMIFGPAARVILSSIPIRIEQK